MLPDNRIVARHYETRAWLEVEIEGPVIAAVRPASGSAEASPADLWVAPAFWDIQTNGRWGISYSSPDLKADQVAEVVRAQGPLGTARLCPTLITASREATLSGLRAIASACYRWADIGRMVAGIHIEGPYISPRDGYRGAHPLEHVREPEVQDLDLWREASGGRVVLVTLAPELPGAMEFIVEAVRRGVTIALGHTAADAAAIGAAVDAGARLSTHLGNGIASPLARHPNPIWTQAAEDRLGASLIADGFHLSSDVLKVLVRAKQPDRAILVSDASPIAGLPPGSYGPWSILPDGKIVVTGTDYLAGANEGLPAGIGNVMRAAGLSVAEAIGMATTNPARLLGRPTPAAQAGEAACLILFRLDPGFRLVGSCVDGKWHEFPEPPNRYLSSRQDKSDGSC